MIDHWQTLVAGILAVVAGVLTVIGTLWAAILQCRATRNAAREQIEATRETSRREIEATIAATQMQLEAALAQTREERDLLAKQKRDAAKIITGAMKEFLDRLHSTLTDLRRKPTTTRIGTGSATFVTERHIFENLKQYLPFFNAETRLQFVKLEEEAARMRSGRGGDSNIGAVGDEIDAFGRKLSAFIDKIETETATSNDA